MTSKSRRHPGANPPTRDAASEPLEMLPAGPRRLAMSGAKSLDALDILADALWPRLEARIAASRPTSELVDVALFCGVTKQRQIAGPCRAGSIVGAVKVGRRWKAPPASVRAWLATRGPRLVPSPNVEDADGLESLRRRLLRGA